MSDLWRLARLAVLGQDGPDLGSWIAGTAFRARRDLRMTEPERQMVVGCCDACAAGQTDDDGRQPVEEDELPQTELLVLAHPLFALRQRSFRRGLRAHQQSHQRGSRPLLEQIVASLRDPQRQHQIAKPLEPHLRSPPIRVVQLERELACRDLHRLVKCERLRRSTIEHERARRESGLVAANDRLGR